MSASHSLLSVVARLLSSRVVRVGFVALAVALCALAVFGEWDEIGRDLTRLSPFVLLLSMLTAAAGLVVSMVLWRMLLADLGSPLPRTAAARVLFVSQLGKYLPGSVWPVLAQMELGRDHGVPRRRSATVFVLLMLFSLMTGLLVATGTLPFIAADQIRPFRWAFLLTPALIALLYPSVLNPLLGLLLRVTRRPPLERAFTLRDSAEAGFVGVVQWLFFGLHAWVLCVGLGTDAGQTFPLAIGGFALAWCVGYLIVIAPAGIGVREVALAAALSPVLDRGDAIVVALASRVVMTAADLLLAGLAAAAMWGRRHELEDARVTESRG